MLSFQMRLIRIIFVRNILENNKVYLSRTAVMRSILLFICNKMVNNGMILGDITKLLSLLIVNKWEMNFFCRNNLLYC